MHVRADAQQSLVELTDDLPRVIVRNRDNSVQLQQILHLAGEACSVVEYPQQRRPRHNISHTVSDSGFYQALVELYGKPIDINSAVWPDAPPLSFEISVRTLWQWERSAFGALTWKAQRWGRILAEWPRASSARCRVVHGNYCILFAVDIALAACLTYYVYTTDLDLFNIGFTRVTRAAHWLWRHNHWLMGAPGGLKVNLPLSKFFGHLFSNCIQIWVEALAALRPALQVTFYAGCGLATVGGLTFQLALLVDLLSLAIIYIHAFHIFAWAFYTSQLQILTSVFQLFRGTYTCHLPVLTSTGRKWNPLRSRVDSCTYDRQEVATVSLPYCRNTAFSCSLGQLFSQSVCFCCQLLAFTI